MFQASVVFDRMTVMQSGEILHFSELAQLS